VIPSVSRSARNILVGFEPVPRSMRDANTGAIPPAGVVFN